MTLQAFVVVLQVVLVMTVVCALLGLVASCVGSSEEKRRRNHEGQ
jgi:Tfp pilus assembly protein PilX